MLANLALHEKTAAVAAASSASPELAVRTLRAALTHVLMPTAQREGGGREVAACRQLLSVSPVQPRGRGPSGPSSRMVLTAPMALITQAASVLGNHLRVLPDALTATSIAALQDQSVISPMDSGSNPVGDGR